MFTNIQVGKRMEQATTSHGADTASNPMTRSVKSGVYVLLAFVALVEGCSVRPRYKAPTPTIRPFHNTAPMRADGTPAARSKDNTFGREVGIAEMESSRVIRQVNKEMFKNGAPSELGQ